eukprot:CAMPEP_0170551630 /NCGR_PEP_ID=MMETSP0211-20121228/9633_1 /TAXON_ID=311385 /ORGANISM="Pseudokeronopsis sp., Strain OXSARD2" /LENGTH=65 /DNA_ID=CAMNT_0010858923 /DNA_START=464 /DNA_END=661 /DNA_ORIENTATION=+
MIKNVVLSTESASVTVYPFIEMRVTAKIIESTPSTNLKVSFSLKKRKNETEVKIVLVANNPELIP